MARGRLLGCLAHTSNERFQLNSGNPAMAAARFLGFPWVGHTGETGKAQEEPHTEVWVAEELPAKIKQAIDCDLEPRQRKMYDDLRLHLTSRMESRKRPSGPFQMAIELDAFGESHQSPVASPS